MAPRIAIEFEVMTHDVFEPEDEAKTILVPLNPAVVEFPAVITV